MWFILFLFIGMFAGMMSGLMGIGGGIIIVPMLAFAFKVYDMPPAIIMHMAAGTSLATIAITTISALFSHRYYWKGSWEIFRRLVPGIILGTILGVVCAYHLHSRVLSRLFGVLVLLMTLQILLQKNINPKRSLPGLFGMTVAGSGIGFLSGLLGIGGSVASIPFLNYCNVHLRTAMVVALMIGLTASVIGTITFLITGLNVAGLPKGAVGFIYWPAWLPVSLGSIIFAPLGASLSFRLPVEFLKRLFAIFLLVVGIHMI